MQERIPSIIKEASIDAIAETLTCNFQLQFRRKHDPNRGFSCFM